MAARKGDSVCSGAISKLLLCQGWPCTSEARGSSNWTLAYTEEGKEDMKLGEG